MGIVDKVMGGLTNKEERDAIHNENTSRKETGPEALALGKPSEHIIDDKIGGTHTRNVKDAVLHENVQQHAHHEVTPIVDRQKEETEIHQKVQPVVDKQEQHSHHQHVAPQVSRHVREDIPEEHANRYRAQGQEQNLQTVGEQTHSTSVNAPIVREHVNKHIVEEIQPVIDRQTQRVEHHHTTQQINESHVKAPVVHDKVVNAPITMSEFTGKVGDIVDKAVPGHHSSSTGHHTSGHHSGSGLTGSHNAGSGLTGSNTTGSTATGTGSGLTGNRV